jgi:cytochrome P450
MSISEESPNAARTAEERMRAFQLHGGNFEEMYDTLADFRSKCPVATGHSIGADFFDVNEHPVYFVTRYDDIEKVLADPTAFGNHLGGSPYQNSPMWLPHTAEPPEHRLYRRDLNKMFTEAKVKEKEPEMRLRVREFIQPIVERGHGDLVSELTKPFPCSTFLLMFGAPLDDLDMLVDATESMIESTVDPYQAKRFGEVILPLIIEYYNRALDARLEASDPPDDLFTALTRARVGDRPFLREEMIKVCGFLTLAGLDTVTATSGRMLRFLAESPDHRQELVDNPQLIPDALEEMLRYFSIVQMSRAVRREVEVGGVKLKPGDRVDVSTPSAGRDEYHYDNPEAVDFHREDKRHLAFGAGIHRCLGSHLARIELSVILETVLEMMPDFYLDPANPSQDHISGVLNVRSLHVFVGKPQV